MIRETSFEDYLLRKNGLRRTFIDFAEENMLRDDEDDEDDSKKSTKLYDAHAELQFKAYRLNLRDNRHNRDMFNQPTRKCNDEEDSEVEITCILRQTGQESVPNDYRMNSKTAGRKARKAVSTRGLPVAGDRSRFLTDDFFKFATPITYRHSPASKALEKIEEASDKQPNNIKASVATSKAKDESKQVIQAGDQDSTKEIPNQIQLQQRYEESPVVGSEEFITPKQLYETITAGHQF